MSAGFDPKHYRFSVRCDRETNRRIEQAARAACVTAAEFVQSHFETILSAAEDATPEAEPLRSEEVETAQSLGVTPGMLRVYRALAADRDGNGRAAVSIDLIMARTGYGNSSIRVMLSRLAGKRLIRRIRAGGWSGPAIYQVMPIGDET